MPLASLLAPLTLDAFFDEHVAKRAAYCPGADDRHSHLFSWSALDRLLNSGPLPHPALRVYRSDIGDITTPTAAHAIAQLRAGAAVLVEAADHYDPTLAALTERLCAQLDEPARINIYATSPSAPGFPLHADTHDVLVLQIAGNKRWQVTGPSLPDPLFHPSLHPQTPPDDTTPYLDQVLSPGDSLYVPRGHWHHAAAVDGPSLHLTIAVFFATGIDLLHHLTEQLMADADVRAALPPATGPRLRDASDTTARQRDAIRRLRDILDTALGQPDFLHQFRAARLNERPLRQALQVRAHFGAQPATDRDIECLAIGARLVQTDDTIVVQIPGRQLYFPSQAAPLIHALFHSDRMTQADLRRTAPQLSAEHHQRIVDDLIAEGLIRYSPAP